MLHLVLFWRLAWKVYFPENRIEQVSVENIPWGNPTELVCNQIRCTATTLKESQHRRHGCGIKKDQLFRSNLIFAFPESKIVYLVLSEAYFFSLYSIRGSASACISWWCLRFHLSSCGVDSGAGRRRYPNIPNIHQFSVKVHLKDELPQWKCPWAKVKVPGSPAPPTCNSQS